MATFLKLVKDIHCRSFLFYGWKYCNRSNTRINTRFHIPLNFSNLAATASCRTLHKTAHMTQSTVPTDETRFDKFVEISLEDKVKQIFNTTWLRENCQCEKCHTKETSQRRVMFHKLKPESFIIKELNTDKYIKGHTSVKWSDGHQSEYKNSWLQCMAQLERKSITSRFLWNNSTINNMLSEFHVKFEALLEKEESLKLLVSSLIRFGVGLVVGCPPNPKATQKAAERIAPMLTTMYGTLWELSNKNWMEFKDTAYTNEEIGSHTDGTYFSSSPGLQVFHCIHHDSSGGETLLVDGFYCAEQLRTQFPDYFEILTTKRLCQDYADPDLKNRSTEPTLKVDPVTKEMEWIRYNPYDRSAFPGVSQKELPEIYSALLQLAKLIEDQNNVLTIKLTPGTVLFVDNWRILHGRTSFTGNRHLCGCYISRDNWMHQALALKLI